MSTVTCQISISLDGFVAGPNQSTENPIGEGGMRLHEWVFATDAWREQHGREGGERSVDAEVVEEVFENVGAYIMGRKMFGGGDGPWDETWTGWWGEDPPYHTPVFVLTHHPREPLPMQGGTTFDLVVLGAGERLLEDVGDPVLEPVEVVASPAVTHVKYRIVR
jgi:dihydrofolate reductase